LTTQTFTECSFCGKSKDQVKKLIVGHNVGICNECVTYCDELLDADVDTPSDKKTEGALLNPIAIKSFLDQYVVGQANAKTSLSVAIANHYKRINHPVQDLEIEKANVMILGPTGCGKTLLAKTVARYLDVPFAIADATSLTEAGYVGDDVESLISRLLQAADGDVAKAERGIIFVDEIDKISRKSESASITRDVSGEGVQQALLKLVEGTVCRVAPQGARKHPGAEMTEINTKNILFIAGGAFVGLEDVLRKRVSNSSMGFSGNVEGKKLDVSNVAVTPDDLVKFGMIPEFVGRFVTNVTIQNLDVEDMVHVLTNIKNSYIQQYQYMISLDNVKLEFTPEALRTIAERTVKLKTGARGLHAELERVMQVHMFNISLYKEKGIETITITPELVNNPKSLLED
jgi:ATP-dependent Clp protease ATP-binding subunit ClpX